MKSRSYRFSSRSFSPFTRSRCLRMEPLERRLVLSAIPPADVDLSGPRVESVTFAEDGAYCDIAFDEAIDPATFDLTTLSLLSDGEFATESVDRVVDKITDIAVQDGLCYVGTEYGMAVFDVSGDEAVEVGRIDLYSSAASYWRVDVSGTIAVAASARGTFVVDVSDPMHPQSISSLDPEYAGDIPRALAVAGTTAFVSYSGESRLRGLRPVRPR